MEAPAVAAGDEVARRAAGADPGAVRRWLKAQEWTAYLYVLPPFAVFAAFVAYPLARTVGYSFFEWDGLSPAVWVGLGNYRDAFSDPNLRVAFEHSLLFIVFDGLIPIAIGLVIAAVMGRGPLRGLSVYRTILFVPQVVSLAVTGIAWRWMYAENGPVNQLLRWFGVGSSGRAWLGDETWALPAVGVVGTWVMFGFCMVLFIVGVQRIDPSLYDAARVDGAGPVLEFFKVTLPLLRREIAIALTLTSIAALRSFDLVFVTTGGGPGHSTDVVGTAIYKEAFSYGEVGQAAALSVILAVLIFVVIGLVNLFARNAE
jgi:raffinose/stachyose/melibiose transport system permease protein